MISPPAATMLALLLVAVAPLAAATETSSHAEVASADYAPGCIGWGDTEDQCIGVHFQGDLTKICVGRYMSEYCQGVQV